MTSNQNDARQGMGWLACLLLATFAIGTDDFVVAGVLPEISRDLKVSEAAAGQLVTVFSVAYAVAAPVMAVVTARVPRKVLIVGGMGIFAVVNAFTSLMPSYPLLMAFRVVAALAAATITPAVFTMAGRAAAPGKTGMAMGVVSAGLTVSLFVGVPIGTLIGTAFGWRATFLAVAALSVAVTAASAALLPPLAGAPETGLGRRLRTLSRPAVLLCVAGTMLGASGGLLVFTYIAPITRDLTGVGGPALALFIAVAGVAGACGTFLGGRATDRWGADRALLLTFGGMVASTAALTLLGFLGQGSAPVWAVGIALALWGVAGWGFNPPMNTRALRLAGPAGTEAVALNTSGLYLGTATAGALGGASLAVSGGTGAAAAATAMCLIAFAVMALSVRLFPTEATSSPGQTVPG